MKKIYLSKELRKLVFLLGVFLALAAGEAWAMNIESASFKNGGNIPEKYTGFGENISPALSWKSFPENTQSFVLVMDDPDAPAGTWIHWIIYNIPPAVTGLNEGIAPKKELDGGICQGINSFSGIGYGGPYPPAGKVHRYMFKLYALDAMCSLSGGADKESLDAAMSGHVLAETRIMGLFGKKK